jgi:hypothetical protein
MINDQCRAGDRWIAKPIQEKKNEDWKMEIISEVSQV